MSGQFFGGFFGSFPNPFPLKRWGARVEGDRPGAALDVIEPGELDCARTAQERIYKQWAQDPEWRRLMQVIADVFQPLETAIGQVNVGRYVSTAIGIQLDEVGALIGRARGGLTDDEVYRLIIIIDTATTITRSTVNEIVELVRRVSGYPVWFLPLYPAKFVLQAPGIPSALWGPFLDAIADMPPAGVGGLVSTFDPLDGGLWSSSFAVEYTTGSFGFTGVDNYVVSLWSYGAEL